MSRRPFEGFQEDDFETYSSEKWSSNLYNLQRMQVKEKLTALAATLSPAVAELEPSLVHEISAIQPSIWNRNKVDAQWLFFIRNEQAQKELQLIIDRERSIGDNIDDPAHQHRYFVLGVRISESGATVVCGAHPRAWLDRKNLQEKWGNEYEREKLVAIFRGLESSELVWTGSDPVKPARELEPSDLEDILSNPGEYEGWISIERKFARGDPVLATGRISDEIYETMGLLLPFYRFCAWTRENDHLSIAKGIVKKKKEKRRGGGSGWAENDRVAITGGIFSGQQGVVEGFDGSGKVKVRVGSLVLPVSSGSLKHVTKP